MRSLRYLYDKVCLILLVLLGGVGLVSGQHIQQDLARMREKFGGLKDVGLQIEYLLYQPAGATQPSQRKTAKVVRHQELMYQNFYGQIEQLTTSKYFLVVNHSKQTIQIQAVHQKRAVSGLPGMNFDTLLRASCEKTEVLPPIGGLNGYRMYLKYGEYQYCDLYFNKTTYLPERLGLLPRKKSSSEKDGDLPKMEIRLTYDFTKQRMNDYRLEKFVKVDGSGGVELQAAYRNYRLMNLLKLR